MPLAHYLSLGCNQGVGQDCRLLKAQVEKDPLPCSLCGCGQALGPHWLFPEDVSFLLCRLFHRAFHSMAVVSLRAGGGTSDEAVSLYPNFRNDIPSFLPCAVH